MTSNSKASTISLPVLGDENRFRFFLDKCQSQAALCCRRNWWNRKNKHLAMHEYPKKGVQYEILWREETWKFTSPRQQRLPLPVPC